MEPGWHREEADQSELVGVGEFGDGKNRERESERHDGVEGGEREVGEVVRGATPPAGNHGGDRLQAPQDSKGGRCGEVAGFGELLDELLFFFSHARGA